MGAFAVPSACILEPRVITRLAKVPVLALICVPASIVRVALTTSLPSASMPLVPDISLLPLPTVTRPSINQTMSLVSRRLSLISAGRAQTSLPSSSLRFAPAQSGQFSDTVEVEPPPPEESSGVSVVLLVVVVVVVVGASILIVASSPSEQP